MTQAQAQIKRTVFKLALTGVLMFGFAFALVPLYDMLCDVIGLNGKTGGAYEYEEAASSVDKSRLIRVEFLTNNNATMPWKFSSDNVSVRVHPGELKMVGFYAKNPTDKVMIGQAVPSVAPAPAAQYFHKTECFCFEQQKLKPGEELDMPLRFVVDPDLPAEIKVISLSYTMFDITGQLSAVQ